VLDTSALIRLYIPDGEIPSGLEEALRAAWRAERIILIPELALAEAAQVLLKKESAGYITDTEADEILSNILELPMEVVGHYNIIFDALNLSRKYKLTVYDSLFVSLAQKKEATLITADQELEKTFMKYSEAC
jgi:predicted nucleic acid-binding protein